MNIDLKTHTIHCFNIVITDVSLTLPVKSIAAEILPSPRCSSVQVKTAVLLLLLHSHLSPILTLVFLLIEILCISQNILQLIGSSQQKMAPLLQYY